MPRPPGRASVTPDFGRARAAVDRVAVRTPVVGDADLSRRVGATLWFKLENLQVTGSFKVRGAASKMATLTSEERSRGVVTCSSGNHGRAVAHVARVLGIPATICVPSWVDPVKHDAMRAAGAETVVYGDTYDEAEAKAAEIEESRGLTPVHPFDDPAVIAGQGTVGLELGEQVEDLETVVVPLSGGGLAAGVALAVRQSRPEARIVGVSAAEACVMVKSLEAGAPMAVPESPTLANALAGGIGLDNRHSFALVRDLVDEHALVTEEEIAAGMRYGVERLQVVLEGGGAVGLAALLAGKLRVEGPAAVILSGGNIAPEPLARVLRRAV